MTIRDLAARDLSGFSVRLTGLPAVVRLRNGQITRLRAQLVWNAPPKAGLTSGRRSKMGQFVLTGRVGSTWIRPIRQALMPGFELGGLASGKISYGGTYVESVSAADWITLFGLVVAFILVGLVSYLIRTPRLAVDLRIVDLADPYRKPIDPGKTLSGHRSTRIDLKGHLAQPCSVIVHGARNRGARVIVRREFQPDHHGPVIKRKGRGRLTDTVLVLASLAFVPCLTHTSRNDGRRRGFWIK